MRDFEDIEDGENTKDLRELTATYSKAITQRQILNQAIQEMGTQHQFPVIDLFTETSDPYTKLLANHYSNDGLHLSTAGYQKLAELIWDEVIQELSH